MFGPICPLQFRCQTPHQLRLGSNSHTQNRLLASATWPNVKMFNLFNRLVQLLCLAMRPRIVGRDLLKHTIYSDHTKPLARMMWNFY